MWQEESGTVIQYDMYASARQMKKNARSPVGFLEGEV